MSSQSVVQGDRDPVSSPGSAPEGSDDVGVRGPATPSPRGQGNNDGSPAQRNRGSPGKSVQRTNSAPQAAPRSWSDVVGATLESDEMTARACRLIVTVAVSIAIVTIPVACGAFILMTKAPGDWKMLTATGSTVFITLGSWLFGRHRGTKKARRSVAAGAAQEPTQNP